MAKAAKKNVATKKAKNITTEDVAAWLKSNLPASAANAIKDMINFALEANSIDDEDADEDANENANENEEEEENGDNEEAEENEDEESEDEDEDEEEEDEEEESEDENEDEDDDLLSVDEDDVDDDEDEKPAKKKKGKAKGKPAKKSKKDEDENEDNEDADEDNEDADEDNEDGESAGVTFEAIVTAKAHKAASKGLNKAKISENIAFFKEIGVKLPKNSDADLIANVGASYDALDAMTLKKIEKWAASNDVEIAYGRGRKGDDAKKELAIAQIIAAMVENNG